MLDQSIFKAYDIRGIVDEGLTDETIFAIGKAIVSEAIVQNQTEICICYDGRLHKISLN
jgi:phosphomannomutase/phosphoglucomutase